MKELTRKSKRVVGGFLVSIFALMLILVFLIGGDFSFLKGSSHFKVDFQNIEGLNIGAPVKMGGVVIGEVVIGEVDNIYLGQKEGRPLITAQMKIVNPYDELIRSDSLVSTQTQGVLGDKFLSIGAGSAKAKKAEPGALLPAKEKDVLSAVVSKSSDIVDSIAAIVKKLEIFLNTLPNQNEMNSISQNAVIASKALADISRKVNEGQGTLGALINDSSLYDDMKSLLGHANRSKTMKFVIQKSLSNQDSKNSDSE